MKTCFKSFVIIITFLNMLAGHANGYAKVLLLTSLDISKKNKSKKQKKLMSSLSSLFLKKLEDEGYEIEINHYTSPGQLTYFLNKPDYKAIFWLSHANAEEDGETSGISFSSIRDFKGNEVKDVFQKINSNLQFLGIVGCNAKPYFVNLKKKGFLDLNRNLVIHSRGKKIGAKKGLKKSINKFLELDEDSVLSKSYNDDSRCMTYGQELLIDRQPSFKNQEAFKIMSNGKFIGVLPELKRNDREQRWRVRIPDPKSQKIELVSMKGNSVSSELGKVKITNIVEDIHWKRVEKRNGDALGKNRHVYKPNIYEETSYISYRDARCN